MKRLVMCALLAAGCGLPLPTEGATLCAFKVYLEVGANLTCDQALSYMRTAQQETGVDVFKDASVVEFMAGHDLGEIGWPNAWGRTQGSDIAVTAERGNTLIHEAMHLHDHSHCNWSRNGNMAILERNYVGGSFDDECARVHCTTTNAWHDSTGQWFGNRYVCTPL